MTGHAGGTATSLPGPARAGSARSRASRPTPRGRGASARRTLRGGGCTPRATRPAVAGTRAGRGPATGGPRSRRHVPANGTRPTLVSLPRDSYVPIPGHGYNKLNAAYAFGGPKLLVQTVQNVTGLPVSHYMGIGFGGLVSVVNDVGGVQICLKAPMNGPKAGQNLQAGCQ